MPEGYTRSRARIHADYSGNHGYSPRPRNSGNGLMFLLAAIIIVGLLIGLGFVFKDTLIEWMGFGGAPTAVPTPETTSTPLATGTPLPTTTPEVTATPTATVEPTATVPATEEATISFVGDMLFDDSLLADAKGSAGEYDFLPFFDKIKASLQKSDVTIGTLETTLFGPDKKYDGTPKYNTPDSILDALKDAGFDVLNTSHTHIFDYGYAGMERTRQTIQEKGMLSVGTYTSADEYHTPLIVPVKGIQIGVLSYCEKEKYASSVPADKMDYAIKHIKLESIKKGIEEAKTAGAQAIIVMLHWDKYSMTAPSDTYKTLAKDILKSGADVVIGTGPQFVQKVEQVTVTRSDDSTFTGVVAYSLGNFISNETGAKQDSGIILNLTLEKDNVKNQVTVKAVSYVPTYVYSKSSRDYAVLPAGKYKDDQELLGSLSSTGKSRVPKAWQETQNAVANGDFTALAE